MQALPKDKNEIVALLEAAALDTSDLTAAKLRHFVILRDGSAIVGTVGLEPFGDAALLRSLAVSETHRGEGLGVQLVQSIESYAGSLNVKTLYLLTTTADAFFSKLGYFPADRAKVPEQIASTPEFTTICPDSSVCMQKLLQ